MLDNYCSIQSYEVAAIIIYEFLIHQLTVNDLLYFSDFWAELKKTKNIARMQSSKAIHYFDYFPLIAQSINIILISAFLWIDYYKLRVKCIVENNYNIVFPTGKKQVYIKGTKTIIRRKNYDDAIITLFTQVIYNNKF